MIIKISAQKAFTRGDSIIIVILAIVAAVVIRSIYASELREWGNTFLQSFGLNPERVLFIAGISGILIFGWLAVRERRKRRYRNRKK